MILLDTDVISALMKQDQTVLSWLEEIEDSLVVSLITRHEIIYGIAIAPRQEQRQRLLGRFEAIMTGVFRDYFEPLSAQAAREAAGLRAQRYYRDNKDIGIADAFIAAIAKERHAALATRNIRDFDGLGLELINPWQA